MSKWLRGRPVAENEVALRRAAVDGKTAEVRVLLAAGTDPDAALDWEETALGYAAQRGHEEAVAALAEGGADLDKVGNLGATPLMGAAFMGHSGVVRRLLELGADHTAAAAVGTGGPHQGLQYRGKTALELAEEVAEKEPSESDEELDAKKAGRLEAAAVLREWAARHPA